MNDTSRTRRRGALPLLLLAVLLFAALGIGAASAITWQKETVDDSSTSGSSSSIALDSAGYPCIAYYDGYNKDLKYAKWTGSAWQISTVDGTGWVGENPSLALDSADTPHISYWDETTYAGRRVKYATRAGSAWAITTVDPDTPAGGVSSIAIDADGHPHIAYTDDSAFTLKYASFDGSTWHYEAVPNVGPGRQPSLALDGSGRPHIACYNSWVLYKSLMYVSWTGSAWEAKTVASTSTSIYEPSLALDAAGSPRISYYDDDAVPGLRYAVPGDPAWTVTTVVTGADVGRYSSLELDSAGRPRISYFDKVNSAAYYAWDDGSGWQTDEVDNWAVTGGTSLALNAAGKPHVSYQRDGYLHHASAGVANVKPVAQFSVDPYSGGQAPLTVTVDATASSDPDGTIASYAWAWGDETADGSGATTTHTYTTAGTYQISLTVTDNGGATDDNFAEIVITANTAPTAAFTVSPTSGQAPLAVTVDASGSSDPGGAIASCAWDWGDETADGSGVTASHTYTAAGTYTVTLTVTDNGGMTDTETASVQALSSNAPPVARFTATPTSGPAPLAVAFDASASTDSDGTIASRTWNWGDGTADGSGVTASHTYTAAGTYTVTLTVTDNGGAVDSETATVVARTPAEATSDLIAQVRGYGLPAPVEKALVDPLNTAVAALDKNKDNAAIKALNTFIGQVKAQQRKRALTAAQASDLTARANAIIAAIQVS